MKFKLNKEQSIKKRKNEWKGEEGIKKEITKDEKYNNRAENICKRRINPKTVEEAK